LGRDGRRPLSGISDPGFNLGAAYRVGQEPAVVVLKMQVGFIQPIWRLS